MNEYLIKCQPLSDRSMFFCDGAVIPRDETWNDKKEDEYCRRQLQQMEIRN